MKIKEKYITENQLEEMADRILDEKQMIGFDKNDVEKVLVGKEGMLYEAQNDENEDNGNFMKHFFDELTKKKEVVSCTNLLILIGITKEKPLMMDDMNILHDFFESVVNEDMEMAWGIKTYEDISSMAILVICTHEIQKS